MPEIKLNGDPSMYYLSTVQMGYTPETFRFMLISGKQATQFETTPQHAKRIKVVLDQKIGEYEDEHGEIDTNTPDESEGKSSAEPEIGFSNEQ